MDSLIGFKGKDFVILAADTLNPYSIMRLKNYDDKIWNLDGQKLLAIGGQLSDVLSFGDYIQKNLTFLEFKNGVKMSVEETAQFIRHELAEAIRKGPYNVNCLLAGFEGDKPKLYWLDYLGSIVELSKAAHGYAEVFVSSTMDNMETKDMTLEQALQVIGSCERTMTERFLISQQTFTVKVVTKDGIRVIKAAPKPAFV